MKSYETARRSLGLLEFVCWGVIGLGVLLFFYGWRELDNKSPFGLATALYALYFGGLSAFFGLVGVVGAQVFRAAVDGVEYTGQILRVSRDTLEVTQTMARAARSDPTIFESSAKPTSHESMGRKTIDFGELQPKKSVSKPFEPNLPIPTTQTPTYMHRGHRIHWIDAKFLIDGMSFDNLGAAKQHVDGVMTGPEPDDKMSDPKG